MYHVENDKQRETAAQCEFQLVVPAQQNSSKSISLYANDKESINKRQISRANYWNTLHRTFDRRAQGEEWQARSFD